ncbi:hypothetical protein EZV62_001507 [Acer yangbiense]|uniref:DC1 domain-containing protein n=1 Tax=Acer yangbiense TaxID=1000413 RepID=A0A5C7IV08_9ROSI|nr:hypothetical protein EZV62_001507 [Acer yangbiense]
MIMEIKHLSHPHNLRIYRLQPGQNIQCSGCESICSAGCAAYGCVDCKFFLHEQLHLEPPLPTVVLGVGLIFMLIVLLSLNYALPLNEVEASTHSCNICNKVLDYKFWTYNCADCNFNVHICCATGKTRKAVCQETE